MNSHYKQAVGDSGKEKLTTGINLEQNQVLGLLQLTSVDV